jgi:hypothetical protein
MERLPPMLAAELARQYDVVRLLGAGGMGSVWLARERSLDRQVAIKVLGGENVLTSTTRDRFRREAKIAARLLHPNIVPLFAFGETPDALWFAMGYVEGEPLAARLDREGRLPRAAAIRILSEISDALAFAHREGVVHRDVKPENILLDARSGRAMLADFGIARLADAAGTTVTQAGMAVGTPSYMSPEQAIGSSDVDGRADIYSLGIVGYRMLLGRLPFSGGAQQLMAQHATAKPADLGLAVPASERKLAEVIMCAIEKDPKARWGRAEDLRDELQTLSREGSDLPEGLQRVEMLLTKFLAADVAILAIFYLWGVWDPRGTAEFGERPSGIWILLASNLAFLPAMALAWAIPTFRKFGWRDTLRAMLHPPKAWVHWWPRPLRRADDIWDRLPKPLRRLRNVIDGVATYLILDITLFLLVATTGGGAYGDWFFSVMQKFEGIGLWFHGAVRGLLPVVWVGYEFLRAKKKLGINFRDLTQLLKTPHLADDPGWNKPKFARLLGAETESHAVRASQSPEDIVRVIGPLTSRLVRSGILPDDESVRVAESVLAAIGALEGEIARLHQDLDPVEVEKLDRRLAALTSSEEDDELRKLIEGQQAMLQRLEQRRQEKEARRDRLRDQLVSLYMQLLELDGRLTRGAAADPELTSRVRALTTELGHLGAGMSEVERLLAPERTLEVTPT